MRTPQLTVLFHGSAMHDTRVTVITHLLHGGIAESRWPQHSQNGVCLHRCAAISLAGATHSHVHTFDMSDRVILTQQLPVARFPLVVWPFKQGERWMARGQRSIMRRSHSVSVSLSYFVCLRAHWFSFPPFLIFFLPYASPRRQG